MSLVDAAGLAIPGRLAPTDLRLEAGSLTCLIGPNGSGKTSLLHALAGIGGAEGAVRIAGVELRRMTSRRRAAALSYLPAGRDIRWPLKARDLIALGGAEPEQIEAVIGKLHLATVADRGLDRLSTGERSRVLIARALAPEPRLLLLDEPTSNLDPLWQIRLMDLVKAEIAGRDRSAVVAMHDLDAAGRHADRLIVMDAGHIVADGPPLRILADPVIAQVFGVERAGDTWVPAVR